MTDQHPLTDAFLQSYYRYGDGPYDEDQMRDTYDLGESKGRAEMLEQVVEWLEDNIDDESIITDLKEAMRQAEGEAS